MTADTPAPAPSPTDRSIDEGLEETFPASDPVENDPPEPAAPADPPGSDEHYA